MSNLGVLYGLGVGPGDPELITVKAFRMLKECPVIAYPKKLRGSKSYAQRIVDVYINPAEKEMVGLVFPMTKDEDILNREWRKSVEEIYKYLSTGKDVAFVTEGDPMLFSTFIHLMKLMQELYRKFRLKQSQASLPLMAQQIVLVFRLRMEMNM